MRYTMHVRKMAVVLAAVASAVLAVLPAPTASAVRIELNYIEPGQAFDARAGIYALDGPTHSRGSGNIHDIMREAADIWQRALPSEGTVRVDYGWRSIGNYNDVAQHNPQRMSFTGGVTRNTQSWITFDPGYNDWYLDADPSNDDEYRTFSQSGGDYNGRSITDERRFRNPRTWDAGGLDLLTLALHELGHALGWTGPVLADYRHDTGRSESDGVLVPDGLPGAGAVFGYHHTHPGGTDTLLMSEVMDHGVRELPTVADILAVASISRWSAVEQSFDAIRHGVFDTGSFPILELPAVVPFGAPAGGAGTAVSGFEADVTTVPEPGVLVLLAGGLMLVRPGGQSGWCRWRR